MSKFEANAVTWFEIPTTDMTRARTFYQQLLDAQLREFPGDEPCFMFPVGDGGVGGCLVQRAQQKPTPDGTLVYLNVDGKIDAVLERAPQLGSAVIVPKTALPGSLGSYACVIDSEGNHVGLHSR